MNECEITVRREMLVRVLAYFPRQESLPQEKVGDPNEGEEAHEEAGERVWTQQIADHGAGAPRQVPSDREHVLHLFHFGDLDNFGDVRVREDHGHSDAVHEDKARDPVGQCLGQNRHASIPTPIDEQTNAGDERNRKSQPLDECICEPVGELPCQQQRGDCAQNESSHEQSARLDAPLESSLKQLCGTQLPGTDQERALRWKRRRVSD